MTLGVIEVGDVDIWFTNPPVEVKVRVNYPPNNSYTMTTLTPDQVAQLINYLQEALFYFCNMVVE